MNTQTDTTLEQELVDELILQQMIKDTCAEIMPTLIDHYIEESRERVEKSSKRSMSKIRKLWSLKSTRLVARHSPSETGLYRVTLVPSKNTV